MTISPKIKNCKICTQQFPLARRNFCDECRELYYRSMVSMNIEKKMELCKEFVIRMGYKIFKENDQPQHTK